MEKNPVCLTDSVVEVEGTEVDVDELRFWSDTFRHADLLRYQEGDVQMMLTGTNETTTYEIEVEADAFPQIIDKAWETGERFSIHVENDYFDLDLHNARVAKYAEDTITIVAEILWHALSDVTGIR